MFARWRSRGLTLPLLVCVAFLGALHARATETEGGGAPVQPPNEFGRNWVRGESFTLRDSGLSIHLSDKQWILEVDQEDARHSSCRRMTIEALVYDSEFGLALVSRWESRKPIIGDWSVLAPGDGKVFNTPLEMVLLQNGPAMAGWPRYPIKDYQWLREPIYDQDSGIGRWSFIAKSSEVKWAEFTWMLFDERGYTSVLLLSRPSDEQTTWKKLEALQRSPVHIENLVGRSPPPATAAEGATYDVGFLALLHMSDAISCSLRIGFGRGY